MRLSLYLKTRMLKTEHEIALYKKFGARRRISVMNHLQKIIDKLVLDKDFDELDPMITDCLFPVFRGFEQGKSHQQGAECKRNRPEVPFIIRKEVHARLLPVQKEEIGRRMPSITASSRISSNLLQNYCRRVVYMAH